MNLDRVFGVSFASLALLFPQAQPDSALDPQPPPEPVPASVERYEGTLGEGLRELERLTAQASYAEALALIEALLAPTDFLRWRSELEREDSKFLAPLLDLLEPVLEWLGVNGYPEPLRAEVHYAAGLVRRAADEREAAESAFGEARALAGPGELRLASMYNRALTVLEEGESWRAQIPEIQGGAPAPAPAQPPAAPMAPPAPGADGEEDPLRRARAAYLRAKEQFVERLRADWRDTDTRANVELVQRRLKELEEIEKQREEQEQQQQEQQQQQEDQQQPNPQEQQKPDDPPPDEKEGEQQDSEQKPEPTEQPAQDPGAPEEKPPEDEAAEEQAEQQPPQEIYLTREEVQRLLERLREHEEEGQMVQERLHQSARKGVRRDW